MPCNLLVLLNLVHSVCDKLFVLPLALDPIQGNRSIKPAVDRTWVDG